MAACPAGHESATTDWCDECGAAMGAGTGAQARQEPPEAATAVLYCASCKAVRSGRFCEECGHDSALPAPESPSAQSAQSAQSALSAPVATAQPARIVWTAVVRADQVWFDEVRARNGPDAGSLQFPMYCPERRFVLDRDKLTIGRSSRTRGSHPDIDLCGPPLDPGVSAQHAMLLVRPDGAWELVDLNSTNGTTIGDAAQPIKPHTAIPLVDGDVVKIGAWTTITIAAEPQF